MCFKSRSGMILRWWALRDELLSSNFSSLRWIFHPIHAVAPGPLRPRDLDPPLNLVFAEKRQYSPLDKFSWPPPQSKRGPLTFFDRTPLFGESPGATASMHILYSIHQYASLPYDFSSHFSASEIILFACAPPHRVRDISRFPQKMIFVRNNSKILRKNEFISKIDARALKRQHDKSNATVSVTTSDKRNDKEEAMFC